jgi:hypothetical protein
MRLESVKNVGQIADISCNSNYNWLMRNLQTIWTFPYQHQLLIVRSRLEAEGIETFVQNELTIQMDPLYSNALGGIKLMVQAQDVRKASEILAESGYIAKKETQTPEFLQWLYSFTGKLPFISQLKFETRIFVLVPAGIILVAGIIYLLAR